MLFDLADKGELRQQVSAQVSRMLADEKTTQGLVRNFSGQWLQTRDVITVEINGKAVLGKGKVNGNRKTKYDFDGKIRREMRQETELFFEHILRNERSVCELVDCNYTFLNEHLAKHYGIDDVEGKKFRLVELPEASPRGGILT